MTLWLYLHFPSLQLDTLYKRSSDCPVAIVSERNNEVIQLNSEAIKAGIDLGMGLASASVMCRQLQVYPYNETSENVRLQEIARWLYLVTSDICLFPPNGLLLKVSNMLTLYQNLDSYWQTLNEHMQRLEVHYHYATGFSPLSARVLARTQNDQIHENKVDIHHQLLSISLAHTELASKTIKQLKRVGVDNIGKLLTLPLADVAKRFDISVVTYIGRLKGELTHMVDFYHPSARFQHHLELLYELSNVQWLEKPLIKIYRLLERFLVLRNKKAQEISLELHLRDEQSQILHISSAQGESETDKWLNLSQLKLASVSITSPIIALSVKTLRLTLYNAEKADLFTGNKGETSPSELISILQAKLGNRQIQGVKLTDDHRPEIATQGCEPLCTTHSVQPLSQLRPSILLPQPVSLCEKVELFQGPERISAGWWDGKSVIRDYFVARSKEGRWLWLYRTPEQHWFIHGLFS